MAKYCRYCGQKMSEPRDCFCYLCRREGKPVDRFYRRIREEEKAPLTEDEQDLLRTEGQDAFFAGLILGFLPLFFLFLDFYARVIDPTVGTRISIPGARLVLGLVLAYALYISFLGLQMYALKRKVFKFRLNIRLFAVFCKLAETRYRMGNVITLATLPRAMRRVDAVVFLLEKFADSEGKEVPPPKKAPKKTGKNTWLCRFCGYENRKESFACKSCGKEKNTRIS